MNDNNTTTPFFVFSLSRMVLLLYVAVALPLHEYGMYTYSTLSGTARHDNQTCIGCLDENVSIVYRVVR